MLAYLRKYSIRVQLLALGIAILLLLSAASGFGYHQIKSITYKRNSDYTIEMLSTIKQNIASNADSINRIMPNIAYNELVQEYLLEEDRVKQFELYQKVEKLLVNLQSMNRAILDVVLTGQGTSSYHCVGCGDIPFDLTPDRTNAYYSDIQYSRYYREYVIYVIAPVYDNRRQSSVENKIGYAAMVLDLSALAPRIDNLSKRIAGSFYVLDRNNRIGSGNGPAKIGERLEQAPDNLLLAGSSAVFHQNGKKFIIHAEPIPEIGGKVVSILPSSELFRGLEEMQRLMLGMFAILIAVMYVLYIAISRNILMPIRSFITFIYGLRSAGVLQINKRVELEGYAEISIMARQFNALLDEIDDLTAKLVDSKTHIYELQLHKKQAELQYLKSQINPHFLYNTLETIKGMAYAKGVPEIRGMTDALSRIFRYSIKGEERVTVKEELQIVRAYISIQQERFSGRFEVRYALSAECDSCKIIKMILQPLVENAVFHGIEPSMGKSLLTVGCRMDGNRDLLLWVEDDGVGMDREALAAIRQHLDASFSAAPGAPQPQSIGILNVNNRIKFAYGPEYGVVSIDSAPEKGTKVSLKIPAEVDGDG